MENVFAERIMQVRREKGLSQRAAAALIGIQAASLSSYESGRKSPNLEMALKIAAAYERSLDWLCGLSEEMSKKPGGKSITRADVFRTFTTLCEYPIPVFVNGVYNESTLSAATVFGVDIRITQCYWLYSLLDTYNKLLDLYKKGEISVEVLEAWKEKKAKELQTEELSEEDDFPF